MTLNGGWFWRFNAGGSAHYVPLVASDGGSHWVARLPSPCGQVQGPKGTYRGTVLTSEKVYLGHTCYRCKMYANRHGIPLPPREIDWKDRAQVLAGAIVHTRQSVSPITDEMLTLAASTLAEGD